MVPRTVWKKGSSIVVAGNGIVTGSPLRRDAPTLYLITAAAKRVLP